METVLAVAPESIKFGLKSIKKHAKALILQGFYGLGACDRLVSRPPKARKISVFLAFSRFSAAVCFGKKLLTTDLTTYGFDRKN